MRAEAAAAAVATKRAFPMAETRLSSAETGPSFQEKAAKVARSSMAAAASSTEAGVAACRRSRRSAGSPAAPAAGLEGAPCSRSRAWVSAELTSSARKGAQGSLRRTPDRCPCRLRTAPEGEHKRSERVQSSPLSCPSQSDDATTERHSGKAARREVSRGRGHAWRRRRSVVEELRAEGAQGIGTNPQFLRETQAENTLATLVRRSSAENEKRARGPPELDLQLSRWLHSPLLLLGPHPCALRA